MNSNPDISQLGMMATIKDLNNPLTSILLCIDLMQHEDCSQDFRTTCCDTVKENIAYINTSLQDLYDSIAEEFVGTKWEEHPPASGLKKPDHLQ